MASSPAADRPTPATPEEHARAQAFVTTLLQTQERYHNHKESMAYTGFTFYAAFSGAALLTPTWPSWATWQTTAAASLVWLFFLLYLRWQLRLRRLASIRLAGMERLLITWVTAPPTRADLETTSRTSSPTTPHWFRRFVAILWPQKIVLPESDLPASVYPVALVESWSQQLKERGTDALFHETLLFAAGWLLYALLLARALGLWNVAA